MVSEVQLDEPAQALYDCAVEHTAPWLCRVTSSAGTRGGVDMADPTRSMQVDEMAERVAAGVLADLFALLTTDVDEQRTNPLSLFRHSVTDANALLARFGARPPAADPFSIERFPDDIFRLGPAAWSDIDPALHEPGLIWGAWKAMTVLRRRRDEGLR